MKRRRRAAHRALPTGLKADTDLRHGGVADILTLLVHPAGSMRRADTQAAFPYRGKDCVAVAVVKEGSVLPSVLEGWRFSTAGKAERDGPAAHE